MAENLQEDWLDSRLRDEAAYIDDAGFTAQVMQKLPARPVRNWLRVVILLGLTLFASAVTYLLSGGGWFIAEEVTRLAFLPLPLIWLYAAGATILVMAGGLLAAIAKVGGRSR